MKMKNKDPAVLFYTADFLSGVAELTMEERGQYITMLCLQHQKGHLTQKLLQMNVGKVTKDVLAKFERDALGSYYNVRMEEEKRKRQSFVEVRRRNGQKGGRPRRALPNENRELSPQLDRAENENKDRLFRMGEAEKSLFSFSPETTTTDKCATREDYESFLLTVRDYFARNGFAANPEDFIAYNESRKWRGIGGESVVADFARYADQWEEIQRAKNARFAK